MPYALVLSLAAALQGPVTSLAPAAPTDTLPLAAPSAQSVAAADSVRADRVIRETVLRHARDARRCYEMEGLRRNPVLISTIELEVTILPTGIVEHAVAKPDGPARSGATEVAACLALLARNWRFERGPFAVEVVVFPFSFAPAEAASAAFTSSTD